MGTVTFTTGNERSTNGRSKDRQICNFFSIIGVGGEGGSWRRVGIKGQSNSEEKPDDQRMH